MPTYSEVDDKGNVSYEDVEFIFSSAEIWESSNEQYMYEWLWEILEKKGLTRYTNAYEYYRALIYAMVLVYIYYGFSSRAFDEDEEFDAERIEYLFDYAFPDVVVGQLYEKYSGSDTIVDDTYDALFDLILEFNDKVESAINDSADEVPAFSIMACSNQKFIEIEYDDSGQTGFEVEVKIKNLDDYKKHVDANYDNIYSNTDERMAEAYGWLIYDGGA